MNFKQLLNKYHTTKSSEDYFNLLNIPASEYSKIIKEWQEDVFCLSENKEKVNYLKTILKNSKFNDKPQFTFIQNKNKKSYSAKQLVQAVIAASQELKKKYHLQKNDTVVFIVENREISFIYSLACLSLEIKFCFLYHAFPELYLDELIGQIKPSLILYESEKETQLKKFNNKLQIEIPKITYDTLESLEDLYVEKEKPLFYMTTSGSTSAPKIIESGHFGALCLINFQIEILTKPKNTYCYTLYNNLDFGWGASLVLGALSIAFAGQGLVVDNNLGIYNDPVYFNSIIEDNSITSAFLAPVLFDRKNNFDELINLKQMVCLGDFMSEQMLTTIKKSVASDCFILNAYGQSEFAGAILSTLPNSLQDSSPSRFNKMPLLNLSVKNKNLLIEASDYPSFFKGLLNNPELFSTYWENNFYKTKDLVELHADGTYSLLGRSDGLVKIGGRFVDFNQIEARILKKYNVKIKLLLDNQNYGMVCEKCDELELIKTITDEFGKYAVPKIIKSIEKIPSNMNGKTDLIVVKRMLFGA